MDNSSSPLRSRFLILIVLTVAAAVVWLHVLVTTLSEDEEPAPDRDVHLALSSPS